MSQASITLYHAHGCHLCDDALAVVEDARRDHDFTLRVVDIGGDPDLEARFRELIPVVEIDGEIAFTYVVDPDALADRLTGDDASD